MSTQLRTLLGPAADDLDVLDSIQRRVLWLATNIVHHANHVRENPDKSKVGGHQASSASVVSILTALYFHYLRAGDRVAIKPHASPAFHAVQYLLGNLPCEYLTTLRAFHGLQAYPSRTKDVDRVDFSTGSVGLGAAAPAFAALIDRYTSLHFGGGPNRRFVALVGDAELDEGSVWEAVSEEALRGLGNVLWIVDLNRQSLDRVVPGIKAAQLKSLFADSRWHVVEAKYGRRLQAVFARPGGHALRRRIDEMSNEEYQSLLRLEGPTLRERLLGPAGPAAGAIAAAIEGVDDSELPGLIGDLAGHDLHELLSAFAAADAVKDAPTVLFAYTIKGWGLPIAGDPLNHSALLSEQQMEDVRSRLGISPDEEWAGFSPDSPEGQLCRAAAARLREEPAATGPLVPASLVPASLNVRHLAVTSSQDAFGRLVPELGRLPEIGARLVTVSPDVAVSTNLGTWINRAGVFSPEAQPDYGGGAQRLLRWQPGPTGQHIELGISEMNLFMLLGQLGLSYELVGQQLFPIGTVYDPFVLRGLDAFVYSLYTASKMIVVGTPSGLSLSPEGGAHQSTVTPSLGIELPNLDSFEPCFAKEVEWTLLEGVRQCCDREHGRSTYLRLTTKLVDQTLLESAERRLGADELRRQVLAGGYRLVDSRADASDLDRDHVVQIAAAGAMIPEAMQAARYLHEEGVAANVLNLTSAARLFRGVRGSRLGAVQRGGRPPGAGHLDTLMPREERRAPIVTVLDGASHSLAFLGGVYGAPVVALGADEFGQSGTRADLYRQVGIDVDHIVNAALLALDLVAGDD